MQAKNIPVVGVLLITTPRFYALGAGTEQGIFHSRKEEEAQRILSDISEFATPIFTKVVYTREDLKAAITAFETNQVDMIFASFLSWSDDYAWIRFLRDMKPIPIFFASFVRTSLGFKDSFTEDRFVEFLSAGGLVGALEASGSIARFNRPMLKRFVGTSEHVMQELKIYAQAAALRSKLHNLWIGLLPSLNEVMWSTYIDPFALFMHVGPEIKYLSVVALQKEINSLPEAQIENTTATLLKTYPIDPAVDISKLRASVAASLGLESLARKAQVELLVLNDVDRDLLETIGLRPGFTPCPGTDDITVIPEGDIGGALAVYILKKLTGQKVHFIEPFHIDYEQDIFAAGHAGPNEYTDPRGNTIIARDERFAKTNYKHAGAPFAWHIIAEGEKTMVHISECNGQYKLVCAVVDALPTTPHLAGYSHGLFKPRKPCTEFFQDLINIGVTQHYALTDGDVSKEVETFAQLMNFSFHQV